MEWLDKSLVTGFSVHDELTAWRADWLTNKNLSLRRSTCSYTALDLSLLYYSILQRRAKAKIRNIIGLIINDEMTKYIKCTLYKSETLVHARYSHAVHAVQESIRQTSKNKIKRQTTYHKRITPVFHKTFCVNLTPSTPAVPNCCCSKGPAPYWSNQPFWTFDMQVRPVWQSVKP